MEIRADEAVPDDGAVVEPVRRAPQSLIHFAGNDQAPYSGRSTDEYCHIFDLTCRIPGSTINSARTEGRYLQVRPDENPTPEDAPSHCRVLRRIAEILTKVESDPSGSSLVATVPATRICIPMLGSYDWGDLSPQVRTSVLPSS